MSRALKYWLLRLPATVHLPPAKPSPCTITGGQSLPATLTAEVPNVPSASSNGPIGRARIRALPSIR